MASPNVRFLAVHEHVARGEPFKNLLGFRAVNFDEYLVDVFEYAARRFGAENSALSSFNVYLEYSSRLVRVGQILQRHGRIHFFSDCCRCLRSDGDVEKMDVLFALHFGRVGRGQGWVYGDNPRVG